MARALEFDYDKAIDKATRVFWKNGYSGTSLRDLLKAIGIGEGSFYNTLKSKKQLYLECLKRYNDTVGRRRAAALFSPSSAKATIHGPRAFASWSEACPRTCWLSEAYKGSFRRIWRPLSARFRTA